MTSYSTSTIEQLNKIIGEIKRIADVQSRAELWYDKKWIIALVGTLVGALVGVLILALLDFIRGKAKRRVYIKKMVKNLFDEITITRRTSNNVLPESKDNLKEFTAILNHKLSGKPSIVYFDMYTEDYFRIYLKDLGMLNDFLRMKIYKFYMFSRSIGAGAKKLEVMFKKFYDPEDKTIGGEDILRIYQKILRQMEILDLLGAEVLAGIIHFHEADKSESIKISKEKEKQILNYLKKTKVNEIINTKKIAEREQVDLVVANIVLLKAKGIENIKHGKYKKVI